MALPSLPIDALLPDLVSSLRRHPNLVLSAEPGAGKTTRVPRALLDAGLLDKGECWILEPRRLAARLAAARVAEELDEPMGQRAGYAVRFEQKVSKATRIRFVTEALLLRRLQAAPQLRGISTVILDEFHERHLHTDLALALARRLQTTLRPDLRILVMSATLDAGPVQAFLDAPHLESAGRAFPVELRSQARPDSRPLPEQVAHAVEGLYQDGLDGHTLVFLPGASEIRACEKACARLAERFGLSILPLHGSLGFDAQKAAVAPSERPKLLLSTNVAESSVTIEGVRAVVDSGLGREAVHSPWSGLSGLCTTRISRARCVQRAGRAGRTAPGLCVRLYTEADFQARPAFDVPEIRRCDLAEALLLLHGLGLNDPAALPWFEAPPGEAMDHATRLLERLGAFGPEGGLSALGARMAALPLHPRLARLVLAGEDLGIPDLARLAAVLLETGDLSAKTLISKQQEASHGLDSDLFLRLDQYREAEAARFSPGAVRAAGLDAAMLRQARSTYEVLAVGQPRTGASEGPGDEELLRMALLRAFPDRVARSGGGDTYALSGGGGARLSDASRVRKAELIVAMEAERQGGGQVLIRAASAIEPEWLLDAFPERIRDEVELAFQPSSGRVERRTGLWYDGLCLEETRRPAQAGEAGVPECLAAAIAERGLGKAQEAVEGLLDRAAFLSRTRPDLGIPGPDQLRQRLLHHGCARAANLRELESIHWAWALAELLGDATARLLETWAPEQVQLPRRRVKVNYGGEAPWIESRLQDFLGLNEGPRIAGGRVPLVLHLLAPNFRAVQVTTDLRGFCERAYRELRPQLSRRYPKHLWPEDPLKPAT